MSDSYSLFDPALHLHPFLHLHLHLHHIFTTPHLLPSLSGAISSPLLSSLHQSFFFRPTVWDITCLPWILKLRWLLQSTTTSYARMDRGQYTWSHLSPCRILVGAKTSPNPGFYSSVEASPSFFTEVVFYRLTSHPTQHKQVLPVVYTWLSTSTLPFLNKYIVTLEKVN